MRRNEQYPGGRPRRTAGRRALHRCSVAAVIVVVAAAGACSSSHKKSSPTTTASTTPASTGATTTSTNTGGPTTTPPSTGATPTTANPGSSTTVATSASCRTANLTVAIGPPNGAAGTFYYAISFRNHGASTCFLFGYPGVSFLDAAGHQLGQPEARNAQPHGNVSVGPGHTIYALFGTSNPGVANCTAASPAKVRIYPPNETVPAVVAAPAGMRICISTLPGFVNPVTATPPG